METYKNNFGGGEKKLGFDEGKKSCLSETSAKPKKFDLERLEVLQKEFEKVLDKRFWF